MMEVKFGLNTKCFVIRTPPCTASSSSSTEFSQIYAIYSSSSRQYIYLLAYVYIPAKLGRGSKNFCVGFTYYAWVFFRIGLIFDASPPPVYVSLTNVIWREKRGGICQGYMREGVWLEDNIYIAQWAKLRKKNSNFGVVVVHMGKLD